MWHFSYLYAKRKLKLIKKAGGAVFTQQLFKRLFMVFHYRGEIQSY